MIKLDGINNEPINAMDFLGIIETTGFTNEIGEGIWILFLTSDKDGICTHEWTVKYPIEVSGFAFFLQLGINLFRFDIRKLAGLKGKVVKVGYNLDSDDFIFPETAEFISLSDLYRMETDIPKGLAIRSEFYTDEEIEEYEMNEYGQLLEYNWTNTLISDNEADVTNIDDCANKLPENN